MQSGSVRKVKEHKVTTDSLIQELEDARLNAQKVNQPGSEVSAVMGKARLAGLIIDKREVRDTSVENMDMPQLVALLREAFGDRAVLS
jgi:hypothetical protein